jgi:transcriptional regulator with XRE-family HTH domain
MDNNLLDDYKSQIARNIKYLINIYSMSMLELAKKVNVSYASIYDLLECKSNPTLTTLFKISQYFEIQISQLIGDAPLTSNIKSDYVKMVPIIKWEQVNLFLNNFETSNYNNLISISSQKIFKEKTFALIANEKTELLFKNGTILVFEEITPEIEIYDNKFILVSAPNNILGLKKLLIEGESIFLQSINPNIPPQLLNTESKLLAHLIQAKLDGL